MAIIRITGKSGVQESTLSTVGEVKSSLDLSNYTATINGEPASDSDSLSGDDVVNFTQAVKGGSK